jgi:hypothetical protein
VAGKRKNTYNTKYKESTSDQINRMSSEGGRSLYDGKKKSSREYSVILLILGRD